MDEGHERMGVIRSTRDYIRALESAMAAQARTSKQESEQEVSPTTGEERPVAAIPTGEEQSATNGQPLTKAENTGNFTGVHDSGNCSSEGAVANLSSEGARSSGEVDGGNDGESDDESNYVDGDGGNVTVSEEEEITFLSCVGPIGTIFDQIYIAFISDSNNVGNTSNVNEAANTDAEAETASVIVCPYIKK